MTLFHAHAQYIYIVNAKYQKASVKALVQVDFLVYAQAISLIKIKADRKKMANFTKLLFCKKKKKHPYFGIKLLYANVQCVYIVYAKYMYQITKPLLKSSVKNDQVQNAVILSERIFMGSNVFMQMFNVSTLCMQSIRMFQIKL